MWKGVALLCRSCTEETRDHIPSYRTIAKSISESDYLLKGQGES